MKKRLYLSRNDKKLAGVCGGVADYFDIDVTLVRLLWILFSVSGGAGVVIYIIAAIIMDEEPRNYTPKADFKNVRDAEIVGEERNDHGNQNENEEIQIDETKGTSQSRGKDKDHLLIGGVLVILGAFIFSRNILGLYWLNIRFLTPMVLIGVGLVVILNGRK
ncbi:PspC domain-containing protein [Alkaliphilus transvaalensis]|uniref:PspC domain-containing protein n=1 Tax=Alkaliphilus transvaalensis TaxID=114628 RepID=UPI000479D20C|nr:PspC domain-containing protein [Alkaliphilus transvaalensis]